MGEKHYPVNGDLPPVNKEKYTTLSVDVLLKVNGFHTIGYFDWFNREFVSSDTESTWPTEDIECWWYLPE